MIPSRTNKIKRLWILRKVTHFGRKLFEKQKTKGTSLWFIIRLGRRDQRYTPGQRVRANTFLIYIIDLLDVVHNYVKLFADDAKLYAVVNTVDDAKTVQDELSRIDNWSDIWQIRLNYKKCNHMHLGTEQQFSTYFMTQSWEPTKINQVSEQKDLGVIIDNNLEFIPHIQTIVKKANRNLGIIKRTFSYLDKTVHSLVSFI